MKRARDPKQWTKSLPRCSRWLWIKL